MYIYINILIDHNGTGLRGNTLEIVVSHTCLKSMEQNVLVTTGKTCNIILHRPV